MFPFFLKYVLVALVLICVCVRVCVCLMSTTTANIRRLLFFHIFTYVFVNEFNMEDDEQKTNEIFQNDSLLN